VNIALFGGTFDPIHRGHLQAARVAARRFGLDQVLFVPSGIPPHKQPDHLTEFAHRYAMVALACTEDPRFIPSLLEAPGTTKRPAYTITTVRRARRSLRSGDTLFFLLGADAFLDLPHWKDYKQILGLVDFIVVSRPGFSRSDFKQVIPSGELAARQCGPDHAICLRRSTVHILQGVNSKVASREVRDAIQAGRRIAGLVPRLVEQYIRKEGLYRPRKLGLQE